MKHCSTGKFVFMEKKNRYSWYLACEIALEYK